MNRTLYALLTVPAMALLVAVLLIEQPGGSGTVASTSLLQPRTLDDRAKAFSAVDLQGRRVEFRDLAGHWLLVNFWATWCQPCIEELPHLAALARALQGLPVKLVLVSVDEAAGDIEKLARRFTGHPAEGDLADLVQATAQLLRGQLPNVVSLHDPSGSVPASWGTQKYPETYLVDPNGWRRAWFIGPKPWGQPQALKELRELLPEGIGGQPMKSDSARAPGNTRRRVETEPAGRQPTPGNTPAP